MLRHLTSTIAVLSLLLIGATACDKANDSGNRGDFGPTLGSLGQAVQIANQNTKQYNVSCAVSLSKNIVASNETVSLTIVASGGIAPYSLGSYGSFSNQLSISGGFANTSASNSVIQRNFQISDNQGNLGSCSFQITVKGTSQQSSASPSSCNVTVSNASPSINQSTTFSISTQSASSYILNSIYYQADWAENFGSTYTGISTIDVTYTTAGPRTFTALITVNGQQVSCSLPISVSTATVDPLAAPKLNLQVTPGAAVNLGQTITVTPLWTGFLSSSEPVISITANDAQIQITQSGSNYLITAKDSLPHRFTLSATATKTLANSNLVLSASTSVELRFTTIATTGGSMNCAINMPSGGMTPNSSYLFSVVAPGFNDAIIWGNISMDADATMSSVNSLIHASYAIDGIKTITLTNARSAITGALCNGNGVVSLSFIVRPWFYVGN